LVGAHAGRERPRTEHAEDRAGDPPPADVGEEVRTDVRGDVQILGEPVMLVRRRLTHGRRRYDARCHSERSRAHVSGRGSGRTRVSATLVMKLVSPTHRGTTWTWRWPGTPAPPARPRFTPMFIPSGSYPAWT